MRLRSPPERSPTGPEAMSRGVTRWASPLLVALVATGCNFDSGGGSNGGGNDGGIDAGGGGDGGGGADAGGSDGGGCGNLLDFEPSNFAACDLVLVPGDLVLDESGVYRLDTDSGLLTDPDGDTRTLTGVEIEQEDAPAIFAVAFLSFQLDTVSAISVRGTRAFALVTKGDLVIDGAFGAPATGTISGAGGNNGNACLPGGRGQQGELHANTDGTLAGGSGGGGGGFGAGGGLGAGVDGAEDESPTNGGSSSGSAGLVPLRGGCSGGAAGEVQVSGGPGGGAGGALQLVAGGTLEVNGYVTVRGGGGLGVIGPSGGGGGGGSGGGILLEANDIAIEGALTANGGGGGEGGRQGGASDDGTNGHDQDSGRAQGGSGLSFGGDGGQGGALGAVAGEDGDIGESGVSALAGGGGGGGAAGRIHLRAIGDLTIGGVAIVSPAAQ